MPKSKKEIEKYSNIKDRKPLLNTYNQKTYFFCLFFFNRMKWKEKHYCFADTKPKIDQSKSNLVANFKKPLFI